MKNREKSALLILTAIMVVLLFAFGGGTKPYKVDGTITAVLPINAKYITVVRNDKKRYSPQRTSFSRSDSHRRNNNG